MIKLFEKDSYKKEFESKIINLDKKNNLVELENTIFYGRGGGQPGDTGYLYKDSKNIKVLETFKKKKCPIASSKFNR